MNSNNNTLCLTPDQISDLLIADDPSILSLASRRRHLEVCPTCRAEFSQLEALFTNLRDSAIASAAQAQPLASARANHLTHGFTSRPMAMRGALWLASTAALAIAVTFPLLHHTSPLQTAPAVSVTAKVLPATTSSITDEALLDGITKDLAASVPSSMQSLADPSKVSGQTAMDDDATVR